MLRGVNNLALTDRNIQIIFDLKRVLKNQRCQLPSEQEQLVKEVLYLKYGAHHVIMLFTLLPIVWHLW